MLKIKIPASVPKAKYSEYRRNYKILTNNTGRLLLIAGDQKVEHLNDDFYGKDINSEDKSPEHLFQIAAASKGGALATHLGLISHYAKDYKNVPYIVKLNAKTNIGPNGEKDSHQLWWTVDDVIKLKKDNNLKIVGIGYTIYLGNRYEAEMLSTVAKAIFQAHQAGLMAVVWVYPRAEGIKEDNIHTIAGGAGVASALGADFAKVKYPYQLKNLDAAAKKFREVTAAAGRTKIICVGGKKRSTIDLLKSLDKQINIAHTSGLAMGRNFHQRSLDEATRLAAALGSIIFRGQNYTQAKRIYEGKKVKKIINRRFLGLF